MLKNINILGISMLIALICLNSCKKKDYSFGNLVTPTGLSLDATILGVDPSNPDGDGSGEISIIAKAGGAISYKIDYGDGTHGMVSDGKITHKYSSPGTNEYTITVNAIGTGGIITTLSKKVKIFVLFNIPEEILEALTGTGSKVWISANDVVGHFGVGPTDGFLPSWYEAGPNQRDACAYDDEVTFSRDVANRVSMTVDNKGTSFTTEAPFYGINGPEGCYAIGTNETKPLAFSAATSGATADQSTGIKFRVPGNGLIIFGTGGTEYEIISISENQIFLRNIGADGNAWYQKLKPKP